MADFNYYYFKNYFNKSKIEEINYFIEKNFDFFVYLIYIFRIKKKNQS